MSNSPSPRSSDPHDDTLVSPGLRVDPQMIRERADLLRESRRWFDDHGFLEVQPPCLASESIVDRYIDPIEVSSEQFQLPSSLASPFYLQTSPEAAMKRMLAGGAPSIYSLGPVFRAGERGRWHNLEFTMLEWYQRDCGIDQAIALLGEFVMTMLRREDYRVVTYRQLFRDYLSIDPIDAPLEELQQAVAQRDAGLAHSLGDDRDGLLDALLSQWIQPAMAEGTITIVKNYPLSQAALASAAADDGQCAARFELFADGAELANGYDELGDARELSRRLEQCNRHRLVTGKKPLPLPEKLIAAMHRGLPPCAGVALGFDRLLMVRTKEKDISRVIPFPLEST